MFNHRRLVLVLIAILALVAGIENAHAHNRPPVCTPRPTPTPPPALTVEIITWNIVGLDHNQPSSGPYQYLVAARVRNTSNAVKNNVTAKFYFDSTNTRINLAGPSTLVEPSIAPGSYADFYFNIEVTKQSAAKRTSRGFHITAKADGMPSEIPSPTPRELFVEGFISQSSNSVQSIQGPQNVTVGQTYTYTLRTSTNRKCGQEESFVFFPNNKFKIISVLQEIEDYELFIDSVYADICGWGAVPGRSGYRECNGIYRYPVLTGEVQGPIKTTFTVKVLAPGTTDLKGMIVDYSGPKEACANPNSGSFHYNASSHLEVVAVNPPTTTPSPTPTATPTPTPTPTGTLPPTETPTPTPTEGPTDTPTPTPTESPTPSPTPTPEIPETPEECEAVLYHADFEEGANGWTLDNESQLVSGNGLWRITDECAAELPGHSWQGALAYSRPAPDCDYDVMGTTTTLANGGMSYSPLIDLSDESGALQLSMRYFLSTEDKGFAGDIAALLVSQDGFTTSSQTIEVLAMNQTQSLSDPTTNDGEPGWKSLAADLSSFAGTQIQLAVGFESFDGSANDGAGFYVDDVTVCRLAGTPTATPTPPPTPAACEEVVYAIDFEQGLAGWTLDNDSPLTSGGGLWHLTEECHALFAGHSFAAALAFANGDCAYDLAGTTGTLRGGMAWSAPIDLAGIEGPLILRMTYLLETGDRGIEGDLASLMISEDGFTTASSTLNTIGLNSSGTLDDPTHDEQAQPECRIFTRDISFYAGREIQLGVYFDTQTAENNAGAGFYKDGSTIFSVSPSLSV